MNKLSIRARVIAAVMVLTGLALVLCGVVIYVQGVASTEQRVTADLSRTADELAVLAGEPDPATGRAWARPDALLNAAMRRTVLAEGEGAFAVVDGRLRWLAQDAVPLRPERDRELVAAVLPLASLPTSSQGALLTATADYRYIVVPVQAADGSRGALVKVADLRAELQELSPVYATYALVAAGSLVLVALLIWLLVGRLLQPVAWTRETAARITETDLSQRIPVRGNDELSALAVTVNGMLDRLQAAVAGQRELVDDVGHELRTPLTIVRGHLELMEVSDPEDVAATRALVLDELDRMRRLVEDLMILARAEQPDFVSPRPTDLGRLTDETLAKAVPLGDRHWLLDELADTEVSLDPQRITQAWLQLAANAVQYSASRSTVALGSRVQGDEVWLWVRDQGVGIPEADRARVLERSVRGRSGSGTGLGLAIVASIARAHDGRVEVDSAEGVGSRISMVLPARGVVEAAVASSPVKERKADEPDSDR